MALSIENWVLTNFPDALSSGNPPKDWRVCCPFCDDNKGHLYISMHTSKAHCFKCGFKSNWIGLVMQYAGLNYYSALSRLYSRPRVMDLSNKLESLRESSKAQISQVFHLPGGYTELAHSGEEFGILKKYLRKRGFDEDVWRKYALGGSLEIPHRVIIPVERDYWQARAVYKWMQPKYMNPSEPHKDVIFNSRALQYFDEVVICEGAFSAMAIGDNGVALIGKEMTEEKGRRLAASPVWKFVIALEPNAWDTISKLADFLYKEGKEVEIWKYSNGDPADPDGQFSVLPYDLKTRAMLSLGI